MLMYCPYCEKQTDCKVVTYNLMVDEGLGMDTFDYNNYKSDSKYIDGIYYYARSRWCEECNETFETAELDQKHVRELVNLRNDVNQLLNIKLCVENIIKTHTIRQTLNKKYPIRLGKGGSHERFISLLQELHPGAMEKIKKESEDFEKDIWSAVLFSGYLREIPDPGTEFLQYKKIVDLLFEEAPNEVKEIMELISDFFSLKFDVTCQIRSLSEQNERIVNFIVKITDLFEKQKYLIESINESIGKYIEEIGCTENDLC